MRRKDQKRHPKPVRAEKIPYGESWRKMQGEMIYMRISQGSVNHYFTDSRHYVYGVSLDNGNMTHVDPSTMVVPVPTVYEIEGEEEADEREDV